MTFSVEADMCNINFNDNIPTQDIFQSQFYAQINFTNLNGKYLTQS